MTSRQIKAKLDEAIAIIADCERFLDDPYAQERHWELVSLKHRTQDFMGDHARDLQEAGLL